MSITSIQRRTLASALQRSLGQEAAEIMMEHLPPGGPDDYARRSDVAALGDRLTVVETDVAVLKTDVAVLKTDVAVLKTDVAGLRTDVRDLKQQVAVVGEGVVSLGTKIDAARIEAKTDLLAAVQTQTKTIVLALIGTLVSLTALTFAFSQVTAGI